MSFPASHLLASIEASLLAADACGLCRLAIYYPSSGLGISTQSHPQAFTYRAVEPLPGAIQAPFSEIVEHRLPRREFVGEHAPLAAALQDVEDRVEYLAGTVQPRTSTPSRGWKVWLK